MLVKVSSFISFTGWPLPGMSINGWPRSAPIYIRISVRWSRSTSWPVSIWFRGHFTSWFVSMTIIWRIRTRPVSRSPTLVSSVSIHRLRTRTISWIWPLRTRWTIYFLRWWWVSSAVLGWTMFAIARSRTTARSTTHYFENSIQTNIQLNGVKVAAW